MSEWLQGEISELNGETVFSIKKLRERFEIRDLEGKGYLVLNWDSERFWLDFAVLGFQYSDIDGTEVMASLVFHGRGPTDHLRECRHTYWGEEGYLFYPDGKLIASAFKALSEFFDDMV